VSPAGLIVDVGEEDSPENVDLNAPTKSQFTASKQAGRRIERQDIQEGKGASAS